MTDFAKDEQIQRLLSEKNGIQRQFHRLADLAKSFLESKTTDEMADRYDALKGYVNALHLPLPKHDAPKTVGRWDFIAKEAKK